MIVYKEFSSLINDLGFSARELYSVSNQIQKHYHSVKIPKGDGNFRQLYVPDSFLKFIQQRINYKLLSLEEISRYATAYRPGGSTRINANPHVNQPVLLKLDILHFFDSLIYPLVKEKAFPKRRYSEQNRILLTLLCIYRDALPQGAPTSPTISNIIMKDFDNTVGSWCSAQGIAYTRYCDDMTFSGDFDPQIVIQVVKQELKRLGLFLNSKKTVIARSGQKHSVTGIIVNESLRAPSEYKKQIRLEMHFCKKYGVKSHLKFTGSDQTEQSYIQSLLGRVNYVLSIEPHNKEMIEYRSWLNHFKKQNDLR